jgi:hypothetical protein
MNKAPSAWRSAGLGFRRRSASLSGCSSR